MYRMDLKMLRLLVGWRTIQFCGHGTRAPDGHSILMMRSTRTDSRGKVKSNIVDHYGHITIPRHLRDILVTEYGWPICEERLTGNYY